MKPVKLAGLEPASVFGYFEQICSVPHGSGNTKIVSDLLVEFAGEHGIAYIQDALNNVILFKPASAGYEEHPPVILQGHMDMVCEKDADCPINMDTEGLDITHDGEYVFAKGTTLGGDNGIAVAMAMALLADPEAVHPALEVIVTVDEETGMFGAAGIDLTMLKGRTMLNLDSEDEGVFTVACAGGSRARLTLPVQRRVMLGPCVRLYVDGLRGGHSGVEIHKKLANANKVMGEFLHRIALLMPICLAGIEGGNKDNAIPRSCRADVILLGNEPERINDLAAQLQQQLREEYDEPELVIYGENVDALGGLAICAEDTKTVIGLLRRIPTGVQKWLDEEALQVQTSLNLGVVKSNTEEIKFTCSVRSCVNQEKRQVLDHLRDLAAGAGAEYSESGDYPAWEYREDSPLRDTMVRVYEQLYGAEPQVVAIHAGLECGLLSEKLPGLDCVSIGPDMQDIHTSREKLSISSTRRIWEYLLETLKNL